MGSKHSAKKHSRNVSTTSSVDEDSSSSSRHTYKYAYTQGLNFVALSFLRVLGLSPEDEVIAFWMVVALIMDVAPGAFEHIFFTRFCPIKLGLKSPLSFCSTENRRVLYREAVGASGRHGCAKNTH